MGRLRVVRRDRRRDLAMVGALCSRTAASRPVRRRLAIPMQAIESSSRHSTALRAALAISAWSSMSAHMNASASSSAAAVASARAHNSAASASKFAAPRAPRGQARRACAPRTAPPASCPRATARARPGAAALGLQRRQIRAVAVAHLDHADHRQRAQRLAQRRAADAHGRRELALGRQPVAGFSWRSMMSAISRAAIWSGSASRVTVPKEIGRTIGPARYQP